MDTYRTWQIEQNADFLNSDKQWFMLVACPGAGKTTAMLMNARDTFLAGFCDFLVYVVPTDHLKTQAKKSAKRFGFELMTDFNGYVTADYNGIVITYQQLASERSNELIQLNLRKRKAFCILDEPHHMADGLSWGSMAQQALSKVERGVMGSGTPFRSDEYQIPFVEYALDPETGKKTLVADYPYGYARALADYVCRAIFFKNGEVEAEWLSKNKKKVVKARFSDMLPEALMNERLRATISPDGNWIKEVIRQAFDDNTRLRNGEGQGENHTNAQILIIAADIQSAEGIAEIYHDITGDTPYLVTSDDEHGGSEDIEKFAKSNARCIISVDMISEGVDIPTLRQLIYATNKTTRLYFMQAVGRVVRVQQGRELDNAYVYIPSDPRLVQYAMDIEQEVTHVLETRDDLCRHCQQSPCICEKEPPKPPKGEREKLYVIGTEYVPDGGEYYGNRHEQHRISRAEQMKNDKQLRAPVEDIAQVIWIMEQEQGYSKEPASHQATKPEYNIDDTRQNLRRVAAALFYKLAVLKMGQYATKEQLSREVGKQHGWYNNQIGVETQEAMTIEQLRAKIEWANRMIANYGQ